MLLLDRALSSRGANEDLPAAIHGGLRAALSCRATDGSQRDDRLPLVRAQAQAATFANRLPSELFEHVLSAWVFGQHVYWSVGRGIADARSGGDRILRLKVVPDDSGWSLVPGSTTGAPRATPDRLGTALSLSFESQMVSDNVAVAGPAVG